MQRQLLYVALLALIGSLTLALKKGEVEISLRNGLEDYLETGEKSEELEQALQELELPLLFRRANKGLLDKAACIACKVGMGVALFARRRGAEKEQIANTLIRLCTWLKIESEEICYGVITLNVDTLLYIIDNKPELTAKDICSIPLQGMGCTSSGREDWTIEVPPELPELSADNTLKVLQLTDLHYDPDYLPGSNAACDSPLCCTMGSVPENPEDAAGYWGDYRNCDTPWHVFVDALDHIVSQHKDLDYVYFTGDIIDHKVWDTDIERNSKAITDVLAKLKEFFGDIPVFPILGNHEPHPVNVFSSEGINNMQLSTQWVFDLSAKEWMEWLPKETRSTILKGGYYTVVVKPGFRIIALNSNVCYTYNWWLIYDDFDPYGQLQWLVDTLLRAEVNGEGVHILSHIPSGESECLNNWSREYARIIDRFSHIISAQFTGHTHNDETVVYFSPSDTTKPISVAFNGGSLTTYADMNPNYKVYDVDPHTLEVLDFESWTYSVSEANARPEYLPDWFKLYSFKDEYKVKNLRPPQLAQLIERMTKEQEFTEKYFRFKHRDSEIFNTKGCDSDCEIQNLCYMVTSIPGNYFHCDLLTRMYHSNRPRANNVTITK